MTTARMYPADNGGYWLETPYVEEFVAELKGLIQYPLRKWNADSKRWWVAESCRAMAIQLLRAHYERVEIHDVDARQNAHATPNAYEVMHLLPSAPPEVIKAVYRALALMHHPDRGGDTPAMQQINWAYEQLTAEARQ